MVDLNALPWALIAAGVTFFTVRLVGEFIIDYFSWRFDKKPLTGEWRTRR